MPLAVDDGNEIHEEEGRGRLFPVKQPHEHARNRVGGAGLVFVLFSRRVRTRRRGPLPFRYARRFFPLGSPEARELKSEATFPGRGCCFWNGGPGQVDLTFLINLAQLPFCH